jgi:hypothetical protein
MIAPTDTAVQLRVRPARRGGWRVEDGSAVRACCDTVGEAERLAEQFLHDAGAGQMLVYDAYLRLRTVRRVLPDD